MADDIQMVQPPELTIPSKEEHGRRRPPARNIRRNEDEEKAEEAAMPNQDEVVEIGALGEEAARSLNARPEKDADADREATDASEEDDAQPPVTPDSRGNGIDIVV